MDIKVNGRTAEAAAGGVVVGTRPSRVVAVDAAAEAAEAVAVAVAVAEEGDEVAVAAGMTDIRTMQQQLRPTSSLACGCNLSSSVTKTHPYTIGTTLLCPEVTLRAR